MCAFSTPCRVMVGDVAISRVRADLSAALGERLRFTIVHGRGTLVGVAADIDADRFETLARAAVAAAQPAP